jgi:hypothetical protein
MSLLDDAKMYARFIWGLRGFLEHSLTLEEAKAIIKKRMEERETNFLRLAKKGIFGYPKSPYLPLMRLAQCEMGDIENMVKAKGLEGTLKALREVGVYITFEEFKGRQPIVRNGQVFSVQSHDFDNPYLSHYYKGETGGTTGAGTRVDIDLDHIDAQASFYMVAMDAHGLLNIPAANWRGILPDPSGTLGILLRARYGYFPQKWFFPVTKKDFRPSLKNRLAINLFVIMGRMLGASIPWPEAVPLDRAMVVAKWISETLKDHPKCLLSTHISMLMRVSLAAQENGLDLTGATFMGGGEPPTPAKVREITRGGVRYVPLYFFTETGIVGWGCVKPADINDLHFFKDGLALIQYPRQVPGSDITVDAFNFTTLLPTASKVMLNVENDDYGILETRSCGCPLESYGYTEHVRQIRSFGKLTGEGVTLVGSEMIRILDEVLPACFGGSPLDYQLLEEEDDKGFTRLNLIVSPKVEIKNEREVIKVVLEALGRSSVAADLARGMWTQAETLKVKRREPIWTEQGKLMPLHLSQRSRHTNAKEGDK